MMGAHNRWCWNCYGPLAIVQVNLHVKEYDDEIF